MKTRTRRTVDRSAESEERVALETKKPQRKQVKEIDNNTFLNTPVDLKNEQAINPFLSGYTAPSVIEETIVEDSSADIDMDVFLDTKLSINKPRDIIDDVDAFLENYDEDSYEEEDFNKEIEDLLIDRANAPKAKKLKEKKNLSLNYIGKHVFLLQKSNALDYLLHITPKEFYIYITGNKLTFNIVLRGQVKTLSEWVVDNPHPNDFKIFLSLDTFSMLRTKDLKSFAIVNNHKIMINNKTPYKIKKYIRLE